MALPPDVRPASTTAITSTLTSGVRRSPRIRNTSAVGRSWISSPAVAGMPISRVRETTATADTPSCAITAGKTAMSRKPTSTMPSSTQRVRSWLGGRVPSAARGSRTRSVGAAASAQLITQGNVTPTSPSSRKRTAGPRGTPVTAGPSATTDR